MELKAIALCARMRWDLEQYRRQPKWFLSGLASYFAEQDEETKRRAKQP